MTKKPRVHPKPAAKKRNPRNDANQAAFDLEERLAGSRLRHEMIEFDLFTAEIAKDANAS